MKATAVFLCRAWRWESFDALSCILLLNPVSLLVRFRFSLWTFVGSLIPRRMSQHLYSPKNTVMWMHLCFLCPGAWVFDGGWNCSPLQRPPATAAHPREADLGRAGTGLWSNQRQILVKQGLVCGIIRISIKVKANGICFDFFFFKQNTGSPLPVLHMRVVSMHTNLECRVCLSYFYSSCLWRNSTKWEAALKDTH